MPEFPEVHTVIETLKEFTLGKKVIDVNVLRAKNVEGNLKDLVGADPEEELVIISTKNDKGFA